MNDLPRGKYEFLDIIFAFLIALCMVLTTIFLLSNLIVSLIFIAIVFIIAFGVLFFWVSRNPFNIYLIRAVAFNNFIFTLIALYLFYFKFFTTLTEDQVGYALLLFPSGIYLIISYKWSAVTTPSDKKEGAMLAMAGRTEASELRLFRDNKEERMKREEIIAKQKKVYRYKFIIALSIMLSFSSLTALIFGFY